MKPIAVLQCDFPDKFGVPRQSGLVPSAQGKIVFLPEYQQSDALRGIEEFSHLWLIWGFSKNPRKEHWQATVRPPKLGGNVRKGVFATRSPFRPNPIGLSCVHLDHVALEDGHEVLYVSGIDMVDQTPIYDIKPYIPVTDCHPEAKEGFTKETKEQILPVVTLTSFSDEMSKEQRDTILALLAQDPRPGYAQDEERIYGMYYGQYHLRFQVKDYKVYLIEITSK